MLNHLNLRTRLVLLTVVTTALILCGAGVFSYQAASTTLEAENQRFAAQLAESSANIIDRPFIRTAEGVRILSGLTQTLDGPPEQRSKQVQQILGTLLAGSPDRYNDYLSFEDNFFPGDHYPATSYLRDSTGKVSQFYANLPGSPGYDSKQPIYDYFKQDWYTLPLTATDLVWIEPYFDAGGTNATLVSAVMAARLNGRVVGVAGSDLNLDAMNSVVGQIKPTPGSYAMVVTNVGTFVANPQRPDLVLKSTLAELGAQSNSPQISQLASNIKDGRSGVLELHDPITDQDMIATYHKLNETNWSLIVMIPRADLDAPLIKLQTTLLLVLLVALGVLAIVTWLVARPVLQPITLLLHETRRIASGERGAVQLDTRRTDELGQLARDFERMAVQIEDSYSSLEAQVAARTHDLQDALDTRDAQTRELSTALDAVRQKEAVIEALSTPIVPVLDDTIVVPIVGSLDSARARLLIQSLLLAIETQRAQIVVLDVTGLPIVDTAVAKTILDATSAARLLGAEVLLVGIRPEVAQTLVTLGVDLGNLRTMANLQAAVLYSTTRKGRMRAR